MNGSHGCTKVEGLDVSVIAQWCEYKYFDQDALWHFNVALASDDLGNFPMTHYHFREACRKANHNRTKDRVFGYWGNKIMNEVDEFPIPNVSEHFLEVG